MCYHNIVKPELTESDVKSSIGGITEANADWKLVGSDWDTEKHMRAVDMVKEGKIQMEDHKDDYGVVIRPITQADLGE